MSQPRPTRTAKAAAASAAASPPPVPTPKKATKADATRTAPTTPTSDPPPIPTAISTDSGNGSSPASTREPGDPSSGATAPTATEAAIAADGLACNEAIPALLRWLTTPDGQEAMTTIGTNIATRFLQDANAVTTLSTAASRLLQDDNNQKAIAFAGAHLRSSGGLCDPSAATARNYGKVPGAWME